MEKITARVTSGFLDDGTQWEDVIITPQADVRYEASARVNGWGDLDKAPLTAQAFLAWFTSKHAGVHSLTFEEFQERALFADVSVKDLDPRTLVKAKPSLGEQEAGTTSQWQ